jgi:glucose/arabinose dehydrogenase
MKNLLTFAISFFMLASGLVSPASSTASAAPEAWPNIDLVEYTVGLDQPVHLTHAGDSSGRLFVVEQAGRIRIVKNGMVQGTFLDISDRVLSPASGGGNEEGLLSLAFAPGFASGADHFYVYYTNKKGNNQVSRFSLGADPNQANPASEELIIAFDHPTYSNHNGGQLAFGPDGFLYIGTGDGGGGGDPQGNAQNPGSLLGKLLRIDVEQGQAEAFKTAAFTAFLPSVFADSQGQPPVERLYTIPPDNPFVGQPGYREEIWALGLRNPWRFSFDRQTGDLYLADVGQQQWEEIDFQTASSVGGQNYGWNKMEGKHCYQDKPCDQTGLTLPVHEYIHDSGNCSVTGGFVYRGSQYPALQGIYLYADFCSGRVWGLKPENSSWINQELKDSNYFISSFGQGSDGSLYVLDRASGKIYKVIVSGP